MYAHAHARFAGGLLFLIALILAPALAGASLIYTSIVQPQTVQNVMNAGSLTFGGLTFSDFTLDTTYKNTGTAPDASSVLVEGVSLNGNYGLRFVGGWAASGPQVVDTLLSFKVTAAAGALTDDHLWMRTAAGAVGGSASIAETLYAQPGTEPIGPILFTYASDTVTKLTSDGVFAAQPYLWVSKDINVTGGITGIAQVSEFFQTFSVPEPCTLLTLAVGATLALRRKRH
jgi:hypothetical protein